MGINMLEVIGIIASVLGILAFFAVAPKDLLTNFKSWFVEPVSTISKHKHKLDIKELFDLLNVEDIRPENLFVKTPLKSSSFDSELLDYNTKLPTELEILKQKEIADKKAHSELNGLTLDNNGSFGLRRIDVSRPEGTNGKRNNIYKLILEPTDYFSFVFPNLCLEKPYYSDATQENHTLRDMLSLDKKVLSISTMRNFPQVQFKVGTGTLVVTKDGYVICSVRSMNQFIAGKQSNDEISVHLSAAEGMYRSVNNPLCSDIDDQNKPSPFATSARSLKDELNLSDEHFETKNISCIGYFTDLKRAQPFFLFYLQLNLTIDEFFSIYSNTSADIHENEAIFALPKNFENLNKLFSGVSFSELDTKYPAIYTDFFTTNSGTKVRIASNHAKAGFASYAFKDLGPITHNMI